MFIDAVRYIRFGWVSEYYLDPQFLFTYFGMSFVQPLPPVMLYGVFVVLAAAALGLALGIYYRLSGVVFTLLFTYVFLLEKAHYLNHFYVIILMAALFTFLPANRLWSWDAKKGRVPRSDFIPTWPVWLIRAQLVIIYFYAGIAKLNADWLSGQPLDRWLDVHKDLPVIGSVLAGHTFALVASYGGIVVDLVLGPLLLSRRARIPALVAMASFHLANAFLFSIGIFPWMMLGANLIFLDPDWPRRLPPFFDRIVVRKEMERIDAAPTDSMPTPLTRIGWAIVLGWLVVQVLLPLRHHLYPGDVAWTEEGHRFSWRMKLRDKRGTTQFYVQQPDSTERVEIDLTQELNARQISKMSCNPDMILEYAHHLALAHLRSGQDRPRVFARARCSLNDHPHKDLVDPQVDLAAQPWNLLPASWILPEDAPAPQIGPGEDQAPQDESGQATAGAVE